MDCWVSLSKHSCKRSRILILPYLTEVKWVESGDLAKRCSTISRAADGEQGRSCVSKKAYLGGGTIVRMGPYGDPGGRGSTPRGSPNLTGSRRFPPSVLAAKIPPLRHATRLLLDLNDHKKVRLPNITRARKYWVALDSFRTVVTGDHRSAFDGAREIISELLPHIKRQLTKNGCPPDFVDSVIKDLQSALRGTR
jgi:hypothetical protein